MAPPKTPSRYDELHDRYEMLLSTKSGTRYERLAALVLKALNATNAVVHDLKLTGSDPKVKHQIDVTINQAGTKKRILLECKDFDISGDKINLDIARSFRSVIEDTGADEGWMVTCNGFTRDATRYAKSKGIKLLQLRIFELGDTDGRVLEFHGNIHAFFPVNEAVTLVIPPAAQPEYTRQVAGVTPQNGTTPNDPVFVVGPEGRIQINRFAHRVMAQSIDWKNPAAVVVGEQKTLDFPSNGRTLQINNGPPIAFDALRGTFEVGVETTSLALSSKRIAELLLKGFGNDDLIIYDDQLKGFTIDSKSGEAIKRHV